MLVACEFSGAVRSAFIRAGHNAVSVDVLPSEKRGPHYTKDVLWVLERSRRVGWRWDLLIAFPPCTYLTRAGARWWADRQQEQEDALAFVRQLMAAPVPRIAIENPPGRIGTAIRPADQYVQPWQFGHGETKMTGLWLTNLPLLVPTSVVEGRTPRVHYAAPGPDRWKERSRTLPGVAAAMAAQWGGA